MIVFMVQYEDRHNRGVWWWDSAWFTRRQAQNRCSDRKDSPHTWRVRRVPVNQQNFKDVAAYLEGPVAGPIAVGVRFDRDAPEERPHV